MKLSLPFLFGLFALQGALVWAETTDETQNLEEQRRACEQAMREDEARDEPKLTDAYKARCRALMAQSVPLQPLTPSANNRVEATAEDATTEEAANPEVAAQDEAPAGVANAGEARVGAFAEGDYPDETRRGMGAVGAGADYRRGHLDQASGNLREELYGNENYMAGASAQHNETRLAQQQADAVYPDETQRGMGAVGAAAAYRQGYLDHANGTMREENYENEAYLAGAITQRNDLEAVLARNPNPVMTDSGEVVRSAAAEQEDRPEATPASLTRGNAEQNQAAARATASRTATEQLQQGLIANTRPGRAMQILQSCREQGYPEQVCASSVRTAQKESNFDPYAQNRTSSARGLYQYINRTWDSECTRNLGQSLAWCRQNRDNMDAQNRVMFETVNRRYQQYNSGRLNCRGIQGFDACNYIVYHHTFAAGNPVGYYNSTVRNADGAYQAAFQSLANTDPNAAMAQLSLTRGTVTSPNGNGNYTVSNRSLGYYNYNQNNQNYAYGYGNVGGGYQDYGTGSYGYTNPVSYGPYQPTEAAGPTQQSGGLPVILAAMTGPPTTSTVPNPEGQIRNDSFRQQLLNGNPNLLNNQTGGNGPNMLNNPGQLPENKRGYDALRQGVI